MHYFVFSMFLEKPCKHFMQKGTKLEFGQEKSFSFSETYGLIGQVENVTIKECGLSLLYSGICLSISEVGMS